MLVLSVFALLLLAVFDYTGRSIRHVYNVNASDELPYLAVSVVLLILYSGTLAWSATMLDRFTGLLRRGGPAERVRLRALTERSNLGACSSRHRLGTYLPPLGSHGATGRARNDALLGSTIQIAVVIAPLLIIFSWVSRKSIDPCLPNSRRPIFNTGTAFIVKPSLKTPRPLRRFSTCIILFVKLQRRDERYRGYRASFQAVY